MAAHTSALIPEPIDEVVELRHNRPLQRERSAPRRDRPCGPAAVALPHCNGRPTLASGRGTGAARGPMRRRTRGALSCRAPASPFGSRPPDRITTFTHHFTGRRPSRGARPGAAHLSARQRSTRARARMGGGFPCRARSSGARRSGFAPFGGSLSRFWRLARAVGGFALWRRLWAGNGGSIPPADPASVPMHWGAPADARPSLEDVLDAVHRPVPASWGPFASMFEGTRPRRPPGGPSRCAISTQEPGSISPCSASQARTPAGVEQEVGVVRSLPGAVDHVFRRRDHLLDRAAYRL